MPTGNQWQTKRTTLVRKPNKVYQLVCHWFPVCIVGKLCRVYVQALFSSSVTDFLWVLLVNFVGFTYKRCWSLPTISTGNQWRTRRTTLVRKPCKVYQQYPQEISGRRRQQRLYVNPTKFTNNTHRKYWLPVCIVGKLCWVYVQALFSSSATDFLWALLVNFVVFTYKCCSPRPSLMSCVYCW
jgi:hypothetical protein